MKKDRGLTIAELLTLPQFGEAKLLAGKHKLDNLIKRVNVMEVPDVEDWVRPGEFLMTTGYPYRDNPIAFEYLIPKLVEKGVSGLGIKTKRFLEDIPPSVIAVAERLQFPLIELQPDTTFSDIVRLTMEQVFYKESEHLYVLQNRLEHLTSKLADTRELEDWLTVIADVMGNPVCIVDFTDNHPVIPYSSTNFQEIEATINWGNVNGTLQKQTRNIKVNDQHVSIYLSSIPVKYSERLWLVLVEWKATTTSVDYLTMDRLSELLALEMVNQKMKKMIEEKHLKQFLYDWIKGHFSSVNDMVIRAKSAGYSLDKNAFFEVLLVKDQPDYVSFTKEKWKGLTNIDVSFVKIDEDLVILASSDQWEALDVGVSTVSKILTDKWPQISLCRGGIIDHPVLLPESYRKAVRVSEISHYYHFQMNVLSLEDLGIYQLLYYVPDNEEVNYYVEELIGSLIDYDKKNQTNLIETLDLYFRHNRNMKKTAQALSTHYNTVVYRMERVKEILNKDLNDADHQLQVYLALKLINLRSMRNMKEDQE
ncbi:PucR family transcriptional regulator [Gracilibacillus sp. HCP3S3_G5_1]|uniref:PucR family transcriptional regulator n=1 Tax=unclassified Gracilibacillus TaxID=2625209 RepID=UPI003F892AAC